MFLYFINLSKHLSFFLAILFALNEKNCFRGSIWVNLCYSQKIVTVSIESALFNILIVKNIFNIFFVIAKIEMQNKQLQ